MRVRSRSRRARRHDQGFTLVEILVGVVIALIAILVIYQVFSAAEGIKRNTTGTSDAQLAGLFSSFALSLEIANAGNGISTASRDLDTCADTGNIATTLRPISVIITDSGSIDTPDSLVVNYAVSSRLVVPALFTNTAAPGDQYQVQTPNGVEVGDMIVAISQTGDCASSVVSAVTAPDGNGIVTITHAPPAGVTFPSSSLMFNMGPANRVQRVRYDVASDTLRSLDLLNAGATPVPLASNIVNLKFQYGIDTDNNGYLDTWVPATGAWAPAQMMVAPNDKLNQIKAIRMAIVVRTEQFDRDMGDWKPPQPLFTDCGSAACPAPLDITIVKSTSPVGNFRYRTYENVVPLRNNVWNFIKG